MSDLKMFVRRFYEDLALIDAALNTEEDEQCAAELEDTIFYLEETEPEGDELRGTLKDMLTVCDALSEACHEGRSKLQAHVTFLLNNL